jgi:membrane protein implicated in regulation of membrane protease activity
MLNPARLVANALADELVDNYRDMFGDRSPEHPAILRTTAKLVIERIANSEGVGCVRIDGEVWTARAYMDEETYEAGTRVQVVEIRGATALVTD